MISIAYKTSAPPCLRIVCSIAREAEDDAPTTAQHLFAMGLRQSANSIADSDHDVHLKPQQAQEKTTSG